MNKINELIEYLYVRQNIPFEKLDDKSSIRKRIELSLVGKVVSDNYEDIKIWAISRGYRSIGLKEAMEYTSDRLFLDDFKNQLNNLLKFNPEQIAPRIMDLR